MRKAKVDRIFEEKNDNLSEWMSEDYEGQLALDVVETEDEIIIQAPIAGVKPSDLSISVVDNVLTIKGERKKEWEAKSENYLIQECYWGKFARSFELPDGCDIEKAKASLKAGILTIRIPKTAAKKVKNIPVNEI